MMAFHIAKVVSEWIVSLVSPLVVIAAIRRLRGNTSCDNR